MTTLTPAEVRARLDALAPHLVLRSNRAPDGISAERWPVLRDVEWHGSLRKRGTGRFCFRVRLELHDTTIDESADTVEEVEAKALARIVAYLREQPLALRIEAADRTARAAGIERALAALDAETSANATPR